MKKIIHTIRNIFLEVFTAIICAIIPAIVMYGGNQVSSSRIQKYGAESPQGLEAIKIAKWINIICIIIFIVIILYVLKQTIRILRKEIDPVTVYDNLLITDVSCGYYNNDKDIKVEDNFFGEKIYKQNGKVIAKVEKDFFGDEVIKDSDNNIIGKGTYNSFTGKTNYQNNNYQDMATKEEDIFGNATIKTKDGATYKEESNILGTNFKKK